MSDTNPEDHTRDSTPEDRTRGSTPEGTVREYYELVDAAAYEELFALFAEDVVYERPGQDAIEGKAAFREFYRDARPLDDGSHEVHSVVATGDDPSGTTVAVRGTFSGVQDGQRVSFGFADFHEFEDGLIARRYTFTDRDEV